MGVGGVVGGLWIDLINALARQTLSRLHGLLCSFMIHKKCFWFVFFLVLFSRFRGKRTWDKVGREKGLDYCYYVFFLYSLGTRGINIIFKQQPSEAVNPSFELSFSSDHL